MSSLTASSDPAAILDSFGASSAAEQTAWLKQLSDSHLRSLAPHAPGLLERAADPTVRAGLITAFGPFWPKEAIKALSSRLGDESSAVRLAVLEVLTQRAPQAMVEALPRLLTAREPRHRVLAIKGLAAIDPEEAVAHVDYLLNHPEDAHKRAGLQCAFLLPYEDMKPAVFRFLARETSPELIDQVGLFLLSNPDPEVPCRLWDLVLRSSPDKTGRLKALLQKVCAMLKDSGLLGDRFPEYFERLTSWIRRREASLFVQEFMQELAAADEGMLLELSAQLQRKMALPLVRAALEEALGQELAPAVKDRLQRMISPPPASVPEPTPPAPSAPLPATPGPDAGPAPSSPAAKPMTVEEFIALTPERRIEIMATWDVSEAAHAGSLLEALVAGRHPTTPEWATALRAARKLQFWQFRPQALDFVKSKDPNLASAALEYLAALDPEIAIPYLGRFLNSPELRMKTMAIRLLQRIDHASALSSIRLLLSDPDSEKKRIALGCMVHFDFASIRPTLFDFLATVPDPKILAAGLSLYEANPHPDNLYDLFRLSRLLPGESGSAAHSTRNRIAAALTALDQMPVPVAELQVRWQSRFAEEQKRAQGPPPPYSVKGMKASGMLPDPVGLATDLSGSLLTKVLGGVGWLMRHVIHLVFIVVLVLAYVAYSYLSSLFGKKPIDMQIGVPISVVGTVLSVEYGTGRFRIRIPTGDVALAGSDLNPRLQPGQEFRGVVQFSSILPGRLAGEVLKDESSAPAQAQPIRQEKEP